MPPTRRRQGDGAAGGRGSPIGPGRSWLSSPRAMDGPVGGGPSQHNRSRRRRAGRRLDLRITGADRD
jgi:hypothetical protein